MAAITAEQLEIINSLQCERLSSDERNRQLILGFRNSVNPNLVEVLQHAWDVDVKGDSAYYLVKDADGTLLLYFSVKCGSLYRGIDIDNLEFQKRLIDSLLDNSSDADNDALRQFEKKYHLQGDDLAVFLAKKKDEVEDILEILREDAAKYSAPLTNHVSETFSALELENLCANEAARDKWRSLGIPAHLGLVVFLFHILPIADKVRQLAGCQMLYLFAADATQDGSLVGYYRSELNFKSEQDISTSKPNYDLLCSLMYQSYDEAHQYKKDLLANFNSEVGVYEQICTIPADFLNWGNYSIDLYVVKDRNRPILIDYDTISFTLVNKEAAIGSWMGKEPGDITPKFDYIDRLVNE